MTPGPDTGLVVGLGELLWDCFAEGKKPGGAPANVAFHAGQLGLDGVVCSRVGTDPLGDELVDFLAQQGLATDHVQRDPNHPTGTVTVDTSNPTSPQFTIHENVAWDFLDLTEATTDLARRAAAICFGTLAQRNAVSRATIGAALDAATDDCLLVYDVNLRQNYYDRARLESSLTRTDLVKLNGDEVRLLGRLLGMPTEHAEFGHSLCDRFGVRAVCVTRGGEGCLMIARDQTADVSGSPVDVADAVGAGDAFTAAWIASQLWGWPLERQAALANRVGGLVASRAGAMPHLQDELAALIEAFRP